MRRRNVDKEEPLWVRSLSELEIVEKFKTLTNRPSFSYESVGQYIVDMRRRLLPILIDGLAAQSEKKSEDSHSKVATQ